MSCQPVSNAHKLTTLGLPTKRLWRGMLYNWLCWWPVIPPHGPLRAMLSHFEALLSHQALFNCGARCVLHTEPLDTHAGMLSLFSGDTDCFSLHPYHFNPIFDGDDLHPLTFRKRGFNGLYLFFRQFNGLFHALFYHNAQDCQGLCVFKAVFYKIFVFFCVFCCGSFQEMYRFYSFACP